MSISESVSAVESDSGVVKKAVEPSADSPHITALSGSEPLPQLPEQEAAATETRVVVSVLRLRS